MLTSEVLPLIDEAAQRVYSVVRETPVVPLPLGGRPPSSPAAFAKLEQLQTTGSFKLRGAANKLMSLSRQAAAAGVITSSTGNHGLGVAAAAKILGIDAEVFLSSQVSQGKQEKILKQGARIRLIGDDPLAAEIAAREAAVKTGRSYVSPYNDPYVVAGQGTVAVELMKQLPDLDAIFIATGGGGLISGIGTLLHHRSPRTEVIGCWPKNSAVLYECIKAGRIFEAPELPTLSESTAGGVEEGSITFDLCREVMHHGVLVTEEAILSAMRWGHAQGWAMEGSSGVALAAYFKEAERYAGRKALVLICGGNPSPAIRDLLD
ncbi:MAG: threonine/serine dehydratase [Steroidobacteraceae bacterium]|jgi:threonine dehydratase